MAKKKSNRAVAVPAPAFEGIQRKSAPSNDFNPDYSSVKRELRRIGTLAGIFVAILIVLAIFQDVVFPWIISWLF